MAHQQQLRGGQKEEALLALFPLEKNLHVASLEGGMENSAWKVTTSQNTTFVLKLLSRSRPLHDVLRELWVTELASHQGIAPKVVQISLPHRAILLEYLPHSDLRGVPKEKVPFTQVGTLISTLQASLLIEPFALIEKCYQKLLQKHKEIPQRLRSAMERVETIRQEIATFGEPPVLCHGDFHRGQLLIGDVPSQIKAVDWTTATLGDRFYDLAKFSLPFPERERKGLLESYLGRKATRQEERHFQLTRKLVLMTIVLNRFSRAGAIHESVETLHYLDSKAFASKENLRKSGWSALREFGEE